MPLMAESSPASPSEAMLDSIRWVLSSCCMVSAIRSSSSTINTRMDLILLCLR